MILEPGSDLIEITRVRKAVRGERFLVHIFTEEERRQSGENMAFLAGCFVVKEAIVKCLGTGFRGIEPAKIEVLRDALGKPYVRLSDTAATYCAAPDDPAPLVSISNTKTHAVVVAVLERGDREGAKRGRKQTTRWCWRRVTSAESRRDSRNPTEGLTVLCSALREARVWQGQHISQHSAPTGAARDWYAF